MEKGKGEKHKRPSASLFLFLFSLFLLSGCGTPGDPRPPRPVVPAAITDLAVRQVGNGISLTFTVPTRSVEGEALAAPPDIEIYFAFAPAGAAPAVPSQLLFTIPSALVGTYKTEGSVLFRYGIKAADVAAHRNDRWAYAVRTRVSPRRNSEASNVVAVRVFPAPSAVSGVVAHVTESAIALSWPPVEGAITYRVFRVDAAALAPDSKASPTAPVLLGAAPSTTFRDTQFQFGRRYFYTVVAVAQFEADSVESDPSDILEVIAEDTFPPAAPSNVVAVLIPASAQAPAAVELSWSISLEEDAAGYHVYRSEHEGTPGLRVSQELLSTPAFRDTSVTPGRRYHYAVTAVDRKGNESPRSAPVSEAVPAGQCD